MTTPAGQRDRRITFERPIAATSGMGREPTTDFDPLCKAWAKILFGTGTERRQAAADGAEQAATFRVLSTSLTRLVTVRDRISFDNRAWNIRSVSLIGVNDEIEFVAVTGKG